MTIESATQPKQLQRPQSRPIDAAMNYLGAGRLTEAEALFRDILGRTPRNARAWNGLGLVAYKAGDFSAAREHLQKAIALDSSVAEFHIHLGVICKAIGDLDKAVALYRRAIALDPSNAIARGNLGNALYEQKNFDAAIDSYREAAKLSPKAAQPRINLANALAGAERSDEAIVTLHEAIRIDPDHAAAQKALGNVLLGEGKVEDAIATYKRACELDPSDCTIFHNLGTAFQQLGRLKEAAEAYRKALEIDPEFTVSRRQLAGVKKAESEDLDITELERQVKNEDLTDVQRAELYFAMAKNLDDVRDYDKAFAALQAANQLVRRSMDFSTEKNSQYVDRLIDTFTSEFFAERTSFGSPSELPVFIIGMPRSGTTLVEQIICSHPQVFGAGELMHMHNLFSDLRDRLGTKRPFPEVTELLDETMTLQVAEDYLAYLRSMDDKATKITDKMPFNFRMLGAIALIFPKARFIHTRRNPLDVCLSCYFARFRDALQFSYNLLDVGRYYLEYERLMNHWKSVLDIRLMEVQYEELVANQEAISREMIEFCGLEWDERCLTFYEKERPVMTASNWQVRQPMYSTSVERWRNYERFLKPLIALLGEQSSGRHPSESMDNRAEPPTATGPA